MNKNNIEIKNAEFILSKKAVFKQISTLNEVFDGISYSWKTNPQVGNILLKNDLTEFSIISKNELKEFINSGGQKQIKKVWFFTLALNNTDLDFIIKKSGVKQFVVENLFDLKILKNYINQNNCKINILLRMKLQENTISTGKHYVFGMKTNEIKKEILELRKNKNIEKLGIHFHRKTQNVSEWNLTREIEKSLGEEILSKIDILNLGGGLPANYENINSRAISTIFEKISNLKEFIKKYNINLIIEPGRFIAAPSLQLKTQIILIHENALFVNCSIFNGCLDTVVANIKLQVKEENINGSRFIIKGNTPDSSDIIRYSVNLVEPKIGDTITFLNAGAYNYQTNFCALDFIKTKIVEDFENE